MIPASQVKRCGSDVRGARESDTLSCLQTLRVELLEMPHAYDISADSARGSVVVSSNMNPVVGAQHEA